MIDAFASQLSWIQWGVAGRPYHSSDESGDQWLIQPFPGGVLAAVVDGLGHGDKAAEAARLAVCTLSEFAQDPVDLLFQRCHIALPTTRGTVMSLASFQVASATMTWLGVGNVTGVLRRCRSSASPAYDWLLSPGGVVGQRLPELHPVSIRVGGGDTLILATDGVRAGFVTGLDWNAPPQQIADATLNRYGRTTDDALVMAVRTIGREVDRSESGATEGA